MGILRAGLSGATRRVGLSLQIFDKALFLPNILLLAGPCDEHSLMRPPLIVSVGTVTVGGWCLVKILSGRIVAVRRGTHWLS